MIFVFAFVAIINSTVIAKGQSIPSQKYQNLSDMSAILGDVSAQLSTGKMTPEAQKSAAEIIQGISHSLQDRADLGNGIHHTHQPETTKIKKSWELHPFAEEAASHD